ncbi:translation initiation factor IF-2-like [Cervus canadensis]|uniref:translation initiation factor IF-2-like n=1 Tax=Cervus canadensis TaxID=1574408 RepID=UPI001C9E9F0C|nr:translation initiation factor IF-2-like [Cervus canadensis]
MEQKGHSGRTKGVLDDSTPGTLQKASVKVWLDTASRDSRPPLPPRASWALGGADARSAQSRASAREAEPGRHSRGAPPPLPLGGLPSPPPVRPRAAPCAPARRRYLAPRPPSSARCPDGGAGGSGAASAAAGRRAAGGRGLRRARPRAAGRAEKAGERGGPRRHPGPGRRLGDPRLASQGRPASGPQWELERVRRGRPALAGEPKLGPTQAAGIYRLTPSARHRPFSTHTRKLRLLKVKLLEPRLLWILMKINITSFLESWLWKDLLQKMEETFCS